ncbi:hypothetical protein XA68_16370 [Ophiocordyceps unilateralis]|uniref:SPT2 chromatin protein n=1 Tax=Ophiocordyceps unilateralis TaxID=268505 RepID=A0A2A9PLJ0_OPHUN|nr:hypothetical protein XA68_16370 [Ophiocordyceps unilateralis]
MPIGDLLAQISGENSPSTSSFSRTSSIPAKRKPDNELRADVAKASRPTPQSSKLNPIPRAGAGERQLPPRMPPPQRPVSSKPVASLSSAAKPVKPLISTRPSSSPTDSPSAPPKLPPKKGSFAEILARGQRAQAVMGQVGKIQHKKVEKGAAKAKDEVKAPPSAKAKSSAAGYKGTSKPMAGGSSTPANGLVKNGGRPKAGASKRSAEQDAAEKRAKRASQPMTGYTGTARPKQGTSSKKKDVPRGGALLNAPSARHGTSKRSRYGDHEDEYDEELDDFIEYDDEEDAGPAVGYGYASDASSDMEAGIDELDGEERRAEYLARREDIEEERLERSLRAAKEDRKRQALDALRAGKRR